jgi:hypothetical protein
LLFLSEKYFKKQVEPQKQTLSKFQSLNFELSKEIKYWRKAKSLSVSQKSSLYTSKKKKRKISPPIKKINKKV